MKTIDAQIQGMTASWPAFVLRAQNERSALWEGDLAPTKRPYRVRVFYKTPLIGPLFTIHDVQPRVQVMSPVLQRHPEYEDGPIPHVYGNDEEPELPFLCLFSPEGNEWSLDDLIAETTIPWATRWLFFYEGWLVTKKWKGGGRHPTLALERN